MLSLPAAATDILWTVRPPAPPSHVASLSRALGVPPALAAILWARGLRDDAAEHLNPPLVRSPNPSLVEAAARLAEAIEGETDRLLLDAYRQGLSRPIGPELRERLDALAERASPTAPGTIS